jgi:hypothetical protein
VEDNPNPRVHITVKNNIKNLGYALQKIQSDKNKETALSWYIVS